jgi:dihydrodipicolinate synthase/N-acetylneuraminate lyase
MSAVLLPHHADGSVHWTDFETLLTRTVAAGLVPAVNMDTGFVQFLDGPTRAEVLRRTAMVAGEGGFVAGAFVEDRSGDALELDAYRRAITEVATAGGIPVVFPSHGLNACDDAAWVEAHEVLGRDTDRFIAFELGPMFVPYGRIYSLEAYEGLLGIPACVGAKHSSLSRAAEWDRLALRDRCRSEFRVLTGNDLAIDMVCFGSDYLLGLSAFAPDAFAERDRLWAEGDRAFAELNDVLQYLGAFSFRTPVPAYRHDAAMFLALRGWISADAVPIGAARRNDADREVLAGILDRLDALLPSGGGRP